MGLWDRLFKTVHQVKPQPADQVARAYFDQGNVLLDQGDVQGALAAFTRAATLKPSSASSHFNMGNAHFRLGQFDAAVAAYRVAIDLKPEFGDAEIALGNVLDDMGRLEDSMRHYRRATEINPERPEAHNNLGVVLNATKQFNQAIACFKRALELDPGYASAYVNLGRTSTDMGRIDAALGYLHQAIALDPDLTEAHSNLLFSHNYLADQPANVMLAEARRFGDKVERLARPFSTWNVDTSRERPLRVGFVSGDLCMHPVGYFLESVLAALAHGASGRLELVAYSTKHANDEINQRIKSCCAIWRLAVGGSDEALARQIRDDHIDILIDLSGHTAHGRLPVFAWKPAPVQVSWLGYFATTGVAAIDYFLADPWTLPVAEEAYFTEKVWRLPETRLCFTAPDVAVDVSALPALSNGYLTLGCFNNLSKMNDAVVQLWARILHAVPGSRLFLKSQQVAEFSLRKDIYERFAQHGVDADRLILEDYGPRVDYLAAYQRVDFALDPFPYPGGTTTVEALWMGVPVLTLAGEHFLSRQGVGLLMNAGLPQWVAMDLEDYVAKAVSHANDLSALAALRAGLRQQALASPIFDAPRFATHFEEALRGMWNHWCDQSLAETHYQRGVAMYDQGQFEDAVSCFQHALDIDPRLAAAHCNLGNAFKALEQFNAAIASYQRAVQIQPQLFVAHNNLGVAFKEAFQLHAAVTCFERALQIAPRFAEAYVNLGSVLSVLGRPQASLNALKTALDIDPACETAHNNLLLVQNFLSDQPMDRMLSDARRFGTLITKLARPYTQWSSSPDVDRKLRVGLVSGDLCSHSVGYFLDGVLSALTSHCANSLELFAYPSRLRDDETSQRLRAYFTKWHPAVGLSDAALAQCIHEDGIDILIDLSGHTAHNRLPVFAWRPAPVQVSWLGYFATTGVAEMDYLIADYLTLPPEQEIFFTEKIWRLPETRLCFTVPNEDVEVKPLAAATNGFVTFGCFNNLSKVNDAVVGVWAQILNQLPDSKLLLKCPQLSESAVQARTFARFAVHGIDANRLIFERYDILRSQYLSSYHRVDIGLDPFPYPGGTTTVEALWMGVPVLTMVGDHFLSRQGVGLLMNADLPDWIANDADDYVARAVRHANNLSKLASLRAGLRERLLASPVLDAPRFAKYFEEALRRMWRIRCASAVSDQPKVMP